MNIVTLLSVIKMPIDGKRDLSTKLLLYIQALYSTIALYRESRHGPKNITQNQPHFSQIGKSKRPETPSTSHYKIFNRSN